ncbi:MAG: hypothetical protein HFJ20_01940 [Clostridia bacterium]|nr:hypothetical protein [Clostridia bacterium]
MESIKNNLIGGYSYLSLFANYILIPIAMELRIKDKNTYYEFIKGKSFNIIEQLVRNNEFFHRLGRKVLSQKDNSIITNIHSKRISEDKKSIAEEDEIIKILEKAYKGLLGKENMDEEQWEYNNISKFNFIFLKCKFCTLK